VNLFLPTVLLLLGLLAACPVAGQGGGGATSAQEGRSVTKPKRIEVYYDSDQKLLKETYYVRDTLSMLLEGPYVAYYASGSLKEKGQYTNNIATGLWEYFYESGTPKMQGELREGSNWGHWKYYFEGGSLSMEGPIYEGRRQDEWIYYYENGSIKHRGRYLDNTKVGIWNYFYETQQGQYGPLKAQAFYERGTGHYKEFYPNSGLKAEGVYEDGRSEGVWTFYHPNGKPQARGSYKEGLRVGKWEYFHEDGTLSASGNFEEGLRQGRWDFYNPNGTLSSQGEMKEGKKEGFWKLYNQWGDFRGEGNFVKGEGEYKEFYESGRLKTIGTIRNDQNEGEWLYYYENGRLEGKANFKGGRGHYTGFYPDGSLNMEGEVEGGQRIGIWKMYKPTGELSGFYKVYYENEKPVYKIIDDKPEERRESVGLPEYRYRVRTFRNFKPQINEFKALIIASNPTATVLGSWPVSVEYYIQERLGYDFQFTFIRSPFFDQHSSMQAGKEYQKGFSFALKQKFYQLEDNLGMFYYGHELRVSPISHYTNLQEGNGLRDEPLRADELKMEYSMLFGNRLTRDAANKGWTADIFVGLGVGYRFVNERFPKSDSAYDTYFTSIRNNRLTVPIRLGVNLGYALNRLK
jgi:uncharacterized protein